jgi:hypothetical protein
MKEQILQLRSEGKTYNQICAITGAAKSTVSHHCGEGQSEKTGQRRKRSRNIIDLWLHDQKEAEPCVDCLNYYPWWVMEYDHLPGFIKLFNISRYKNFTNDLNVVKAEVAKCELVCSNCHKHRTHLRRNKISLKNSEHLV